MCAIVQILESRNPVLWIFVKLCYFFFPERLNSQALTLMRTVGQAQLSSTKIQLRDVWESCLPLRGNTPQAKQPLSCNRAFGLEEFIISSGTVPFTGDYFIPRSSLESKLKLFSSIFSVSRHCFDVSRPVRGLLVVLGDLTFYKIASCFRVLIQDQDGSHIKGLLINFIHHNWPSLLKHGFLEEFITPIVKVWVLLMRFYLLLTVQQKS